MLRITCMPRRRYPPAGMKVMEYFTDTDDKDEAFKLVMVAMKREVPKLWDYYTEFKIEKVETL